MLAALEHGYTLNTAIYAPQTLVTKYRTGYNEPSQCAHQHWCPQNSSKSDTGTQTMWSGWGKSVNTYWVQVEERVGAAKAVRMAQRLGLRWHTDIDRLQASPAHANSWGAFTLGVADTTPLEMAAAYATVAADGLYCQPLPVLSITDQDGKPVMMKRDGERVPVASQRCAQAVSRGVARGALDAMRCTTGYGAARGGCGGWSTAPSTYAQVRRPFAGKTGTTDDNRSVWFIGFTPQLAGVSMVADPDNPFDLAGGWQYHKPQNVVAGTVRDAMRGKPVRYFIPPPVSIVGQGHHARTRSSSSYPHRHTR
jgi:membrane peptidoglycan carboxypeptidase